MNRTYGGGTAGLLGRDYNRVLEARSDEGKMISVNCQRPKKNRDCQERSDFLDREIAGGLSGRRGGVRKCVQKGGVLLSDKLQCLRGEGGVLDSVGKKTLILGSENRVKGVCWRLKGERGSYVRKNFLGRVKEAFFNAQRGRARILFGNAGKNRCPWKYKKSSMPSKTVGCWEKTTQKVWPPLIGTN